MSERAVYGTYIPALGEFYPEVVAAFRAMSWELSTAWLRQTLYGIESELGPLTYMQLRRGLAMALRRIDRTFAAERAGGKPVGQIQPYCAAIVRRSLMEVRDDATPDDW